MNISDLLVMRHEILLVLLMLVILVAEIVSNNKKGIKTFSLILFGIVTVVGFLPTEIGTIFGGSYTTSYLQVMMKNILNIGAFVVLLQANEWLNKSENINKATEYFMILIATLVGMNFMISAGDFLMLYLGLETASIPLAVLVAYDKNNHKSSEASIKFILISAFSSAIMLYGISLIYGATGSLYFQEISPLINLSPLKILAFIMFFSGFAFKISIVPYHLWAADVYEGAPVNVTAYLSVISKGAAVFAFSIVLLKVFTGISEATTHIIWIASLLTMTIGNLFAIRQKNIKRFFAFSSIAQAGFLLLGVLGASRLGMASITYYVMVYIFTNLAAFGVIAIVSLKTGKENIDDYDGFYLSNPKLALIMTLAIFSLAGIPPVAGFFGKFFLFAAAAQKGFYILVSLAVINTVVSLYYYLLIIKAMFINPNNNPIEYIYTDKVSKLAFGICIFGIVVFGIWSFVYEYISSLSLLFV